MTPLFLVAVLAVSFAGLFYWAIRHLPNERWQMLATIPWRKNADGSWQCINATYYGFFIAWGGVLALMVVLFLLTSTGATLPVVALVAGTTLIVGMIAARAVARLVEKKRHTFTVAGAFAVGYATLPLSLTLAGRLLPEDPLPHFSAVLAASLTGYALGEGIGRLSCLSFGCCYGKRIDQLTPATRRWFEPIAMRFQGATKKIAYAEGQEGVAVVPIQAISAILNGCVGLIGMVLFLYGMISASLVFSATMALGWRVISEWFRADYRGGGKVSAYQWMSLVLIGVSWGIAAWAPAPAVTPDLLAGLRTLWHPATLIGLQLAWIALFLRFGRSSVTYATAHFHVHTDRV